MEEQNMGMFGEDIKANVGMISMKTLEEWANRNERFVELTSANEIQKVLSVLKEKLNEKEIRECYRKAITQELFEEAFKNNVIVVFARAAVEEFFKCGKTAEELLEDEEFVRTLIEVSVDYIVQATCNAVESTERMCAFENLMDDLGLHIRDEE